VVQSATGLAGGKKRSAGRLQQSITRLDVALRKQNAEIEEIHIQKSKYDFFRRVKKARKTKKQNQHPQKWGRVKTKKKRSRRKEDNIR
jgi:hypothetical protein